MRTFLAFFLGGFFLLCGCLILRSGVLCSRSCMLLQSTEEQTSPVREPPASDAQRLEAAGDADVRAFGGPLETLILGAEDPAIEDPTTGFKLQLKLSTRGAAIKNAVFSNGDGKGFDNRDPSDPQPLVLLRSVDGDVLSLANGAFVLVEQGRQLDLGLLSWSSLGVEGSPDGSQTARFEALIGTTNQEPVVKLVKSYTARPGSYLVDCTLKVENLSGSEQEVRFDMVGPVGIGREGFRTDMRKVVGGFLASDGQITASRQEIHGSFLSRRTGLKDASEEYEEALRTRSRVRIDEAAEKLRIGRNLPDRQKQAKFLWAAITNKYFAAILRPVPDEHADYCGWIADRTGFFYNPDGDKRGDSGDETVAVKLKVAQARLGAQGEAESVRKYNFQVYLGPKDKSLFDKNDLYSKLGFVQTIDFLACCCPASIIRPLAFGILALMKWMHFFIGNYGVVIIILVFLFRLIIHPVTKKSQVSMSGMSKLGPRVEEIKKKYANNKAELNKQLMALYREHGFSPVMGMLPMMLQMPIWIALWSAVYASIDLRGASFLPFWITDLSVPDALFTFPPVELPLFGKLGSFNLLPILMGVAFYLQQKLMPSQAATSANPQVAQQQKIMMIMLPLMFPLMLYRAPSGVNLYIMASTFAGVIEQYVIRKHIRQKEEAEAKGLVRATSKTGGKAKKKKPKPFFKKF